ncbi:MAG: response regulator [Alphaproteobacteria bacterium]|nr:response regulator [Alphaproteobacteria bacterium]
MTEQKPFANRRILVVDDETFSQDIVRRMLVSLGATVAAAPDGEAAIEALKTPEPVDCVITDFNIGPPPEKWSTLNYVF